MGEYSNTESIKQLPDRSFAQIAPLHLAIYKLYIGTRCEIKNHRDGGFYMTYYGRGERI
jgi:hypothetical protein